MITFREIIGTFGPPGVPAVMCGGTFAMFVFVEQVASKDAKAALTRHLKTFDFQRVSALAGGACEIFSRIFGTKHFSFRCFWRSVCFTIGAITFFSVISFLMTQESPFSKAQTELVLLWIGFSIPIDFLNLYKTRLLLRILTAHALQRHAILIALVVADFVVGYALFVIMLVIIMIIMIAQMLGELFSFQGAISGLQNIFAFLDRAFKEAFSLKESFGVLFYAEMLPSIWLWLYVLGVVFAKLALRAEPAFKWLTWFLDIDAAPFRSVGVIAAGFTLIAASIVVGLSFISP